MSLDDTLGTLAAAADSFSPPSEDSIRKRAYRLRRRRRTARIATVASLAVGTAAVATGIVSLPSRSTPGSSFTLGLLAVPAVSAAEPGGCAGEGLDVVIRAADVPRLTYALGNPERAGGAKAAFGRRFSSACAPAPPAVAAVDTNADGTIVRAVSIWGPNAVPSATTGTRPVTVRGTTGTVRAPAPASLEIAWRQADGTQWVAQLSGFDDAAALAAVNGFDLRGDVASSLPRGLRVVDAAVAGGPGNYWFAGYGYGGKTLQLTATDRKIGPLEVLASGAAPGTTRLVRVGTVPALYSPGAENSGCLVWDPAPDSRLQLCGRFGLDDLVSFATDVGLAE